MNISAPTAVCTSPMLGWEAAEAAGFAAALWRLPRQVETHLIVSFETTPRQTKIVLEDLPAGFAVSPFANADGSNALFINADVYLKTGSDASDATETYAVPEAHSGRQLWQQELHKTTSKTPSKSQPWYFEAQPNLQRQFEDTVAAAVAAIEAGQMQKVVLSRTKTAPLPAGFEPTEAFKKLCNAYPNAFVSLVHLPHLEQIWLCASPETLVSLDKNGIFKTVSLAGTQSAIDANGQLLSVRQAQWTHKEIEEQALVSRYIIECFKKIRVREYVEEGPKTVIAGNLMHLRTDYTVDTHEIRFPQLASVMLELLHPTSAVCGMPKFPALQFIENHEGYPREFYSGFLGPVNLENETHLFVHLRCLKIENQTVTLYAGGGITEDSVPEKEWKETELKCQTLLSVL
jgi:isochorismate synthase